MALVEPTDGHLSDGGQKCPVNINQRSSDLHDFSNEFNEIKRLMGFSSPPCSQAQESLKRGRKGRTVKRQLLTSVLVPGAIIKPGVVGLGRVWIGGR